jgi:hypothetical protein
MNTEEEIAEWWAEFERELAKQVKPNDPNPPPLPTMPQPKIPTQIVFKRGGTSYYTLHDDYQFPVDADYPDAQGWESV